MACAVQVNFGGSVSEFGGHFGSHYLINEGNQSVQFVIIVLLAS